MKTSLFTAALAAALIVGSAATSYALPAPPSLSKSIQQNSSSLIETVRYRGYRHVGVHRGYRHAGLYRGYRHVSLYRGYRHAGIYGYRGFRGYRWAGVRLYRHRGCW